MMARLCQIREAYEPTPEEEEIELGRRSRFGHVRNPAHGRPTGQLVGTMTILGTGGFEGFDALLADLPEGAKIGDEFELEFKTVKRGK